MDEQKYEIDVICTNCGLSDKVKIDKGKLVDQQPCPSCSNETLKRNLNAHLKRRSIPRNSFR